MITTILLFLVSVTAWATGSEPSSAVEFAKAHGIKTPRAAEHIWAQLEVSRLSERDYAKRAFSALQGRQYTLILGDASAIHKQHPGNKILEHLEKYLDSLGLDKKPGSLVFAGDLVPLGEQTFSERVEFLARQYLSLLAASKLSPDKGFAVAGNYDAWGGEGREIASFGVKEQDSFQRRFKEKGLTLVTANPKQTGRTRIYGHSFESMLRHFSVNDGPNMKAALPEEEKKMFRPVAAGVGLQLSADVGAEFVTISEHWAPQDDVVSLMTLAMASRPDVYSFYALTWGAAPKVYRFEMSLTGQVQPKVLDFFFAGKKMN